jgi:uncharacterized protein (DUF58 family)
VLPIVVAVAAVLSTTPTLVMGSLFPLILIALLLNFDSKSQIQISFEAEKGVLRVGDEISFRAKVSVERGFGLLFVKLPAVDSFELLGDDETNVHLMFKGFRKIEHRVYTYRMKALRRGIFQFPDVSYIYYPPLSLTRTLGTSPSNVELRVLPKVQLLKRSQLSLRALYELPRTSRTRLGPHSTDFLSIREYTVGDPYKFINWKASSRSVAQDKLLVNEYEREGLRTFLFILDRSEVMRRGTAEENCLEYGIAYLLSFSKILLNYGMNVGLWLEPEAGALGNRKYENSYIVPSSGTDHYQRIKELLLAVELGREEKKAAVKDFLPKSFNLPSAFLLRIIRELVPHVILVTNFEKSNRFSLARFTREIQSAGAYSVSILDVIPYNIVSKYTALASSPKNNNTYVNTTGLLFKSLLTSTKKKDEYSILSKSVRIIPWDPANESVGRAVKLSLALMRKGVVRRS